MFVNTMSLGQYDFCCGLGYCVLDKCLLN